MATSRRSFLKAAGLATIAAGADAHAAPGHAAGQESMYAFFNAEEAAFIEAAVARLIPADEAGPGALEAGVPNYIDRQLAGGWGAGERLYRSGPWRQGTPRQGYQLPFTPAELFRNSLRGLRERQQADSQPPFESRSPQQQDEFLKALSEDSADLHGVPASIFFESLWALTVEGFFSDPVYGGNRDMVAWKMIGFPGAYANYYQLVDLHGMSYDRAPMSLAENASGVITIHPDGAAPHHSHGGK